MSLSLRSISEIPGVASSCAHQFFYFVSFGGGGGGVWALIRGWALINFSYLQGGRLFEVGAYSRLSA